VRFYAAFGPMFRAAEARGYIESRYAGMFAESESNAQP
jgi:hypothetical protein